MNKIKDFLESNGIEVINVGIDKVERCDYPDYAYKVAKAVANKEVDCGVLMCGTGIGISIAANKVKGIRAAVCTNTYMAEMTKRHNNANIIALGGRVISSDEAKEIVKAWWNATYEGGRHQNRLDKITQIENEQ